MLFCINTAKYVDYLELRFNGDGKGSNYVTYKIFYYISVNDDGKLNFNIIQMGHFDIGFTSEVNAITSSLDDSYKVNVLYNNTQTTYFIGNKSNTEHESLHLNGVSYDKAFLNSYDYKGTDASTKYFYYYTGNVSADSNHYGITIYDESTKDNATYSSLFAQIGNRSQDDAEAQAIDKNNVTRAQVYGESIRVTIRFALKYRKVNSENRKVLISGTNASSFKSFRMIDASNNQIGDEADYYKSLYYQTVVLNIASTNRTARYSESVNYYSDIINTSNKSNNAGAVNLTPIASSMVNGDTYEKYLSEQTIAGDYISLQVGSTIYNASVSRRIYLNTDEKTRFYIGENIAEYIVGGKLVGFSTIDYKNSGIDHGSFYFDGNSSRTYQENMVEFKAYSTQNGVAINYTKDADMTGNIFSLNRGTVADPEIQNYGSTYLYRRTVGANQVYFLDYYNATYLYYDGGLNRFRYIISIYEPVDFSFEIDYNVSGETGTLEDEIDGLQNYASVSLSSGSTVHSANYTTTWAYETPYSDFVDKNNNATYHNYTPADFSSYTNRLAEGTASNASTSNKEFYYSNTETATYVYEFKTEKERIYYIVVDGIKYYLQINYKDENNNYDTPFTELTGPTVASGYLGGIYLRAYKDYNTLSHSQYTKEDYGQIKELENYLYYYYHISLTELNVQYPNKAQDYDYGIEWFNVRIALKGKTYYAYYHDDNNLVRDNTTSKNYYYDTAHARTIEYDGKRYSYDSANLTWNVVSPENTDGPYTIKETFNFLYTDKIEFNNVPTHEHYVFMGWQVSLGGYNGTIILPKTQAPGTSGMLYYNYMRATGENSGSEYGALSIVVNINNVGGAFFLAGGASSYYSDWFNADGTFKSDRKITLTAIWEPVDVYVDAYFDVVTGGGGVNIIKYENEEYDIKTVQNINVYLGGTQVSSSSGLYTGTVTFKYNMAYKMSSIGELLTSNVYNLNANFLRVASSTTELYFLGWGFYLDNAQMINTYHSITDEAGDYAIFETGVDHYHDRTIGDYLNTDTDTLRISVFAFYVTKMYNFSLTFNPMGGSTDNTNNNSKSYISNEIDSQYNDNGVIYNTSLSQSTYLVSVGKGENNASPLKYVANGSVDGYAPVGINTENKNYQISSAGFYVGVTAFIEVLVNKEYYLKTVTISNLILKDSDGQLDMFDLVFSFDTATSTWSLPNEIRGKKGGKILNKSVNGTATVEYTFGGDDNNKIKIASVNKTITNSAGTDIDYVGYSFTIGPLVNPGSIANYGDLPTGQTGFNLTTYLESKYVEDEVITTTNQTENTHVLMYACQPLSNIYGQPVKNNGTENAYIWIGTTKYLFQENWQKQHGAGYYLIYNTGNANAVPQTNYTYDSFCNQASGNLAVEMYVYFDGEKVFYPIKNGGTDAGTGTSTNINSSVQIGYDNTRIIAIDPAQAKVKFSTSPNSATESEQYEIKNFLSKITISVHGTAQGFIEFGQTTRTPSESGNLRTYGNFQLNKSNTSSNIISTYDIVGKSISSFGEMYVVNEAYKITVPRPANTSDTNYFASAVNYYFYVARTAEGKTRYFIFYDEKTSTFSEMGKILSFNFEFTKFETKIYMTINDNNDLYTDNGDIAYPISFKFGTVGNSGNVSYSTFYSFTSGTDKIETRYAIGRSNSLFGDSNWHFAYVDEDGYLTNQEGYVTNPTADNLFLLSAKSGYLIKSIRVYVPNKIYNPATNTFSSDSDYLILDMILNEESLFSNLKYYQTGGNYSYTSLNASNILESSISYTINSGPTKGYSNSRLSETSGKFGLYYSQFASVAWQYGNTSSYNMDQIYLMLGGMYEDVKIEVETISFVDFVFDVENSNLTSTTNPLVKSSASLAKVGSNPYAILNLSDTCLTVYVPDDNNSEIPFELNNWDNNKDIGFGYGTDTRKLYLLKYYYDNTVLNNGVGNGTLRLSFLGTATKVIESSGSSFKIANGLHFLATGTDYSYYFTNGRFYNETSYDTNNSKDSFARFTDYAGRNAGRTSTSTDKPFEYVQLEAGSVYSNGKIYYKIDDGIFKRYDKSSSQFLNLWDKVFKSDLNLYFQTGMTMTRATAPNNVFDSSRTYYVLDPVTGSYVKYKVTPKDYDIVLKSDESVYTYNMQKTSKMVYMFTGYMFKPSYSGYFLQSGYQNSAESTNKFMLAVRVVENNIPVSTGSYVYNDYLKKNTSSYIDDSNKVMYKTNGSESGVLEQSDNHFQIGEETVPTQYYQMDNTSKLNSWFNDTMLTKIKFRYNLSETAGIGVESDGSNGYYWQDQPNLSNTNVTGYGMRWRYDEIPGYYLRYVSVNIPGCGYYLFDINTILNGNYNSDTHIIQFVKDKDTYYFALTYNSDNTGANYSHFIFETFTLIDSNATSLTDKLKSVKIVANGMQVSFLSMALLYKIQYNNYGKPTAISTDYGAMQGLSAVAGDSTQDVYYDSEVSLNCKASLPGYTFIGWGSQNYYNGTSNSNASRFTAGNSTNEFSTWNTSSSWFDVTSYFTDSNYDKLKSLCNCTDSLPGGAFYVSGARFVTDTGYKGDGSQKQNYNFWCGYANIFGENVGNWKYSQSSDYKQIQLYSIFMVNTYAIQFDVNTGGGTSYLDFDGSLTFDTSFLPDRTGFVKDLVTYYAYVVFDTNLWYISQNPNNDLIFSYRNTGTASPYTISSLAKSGSNEANLVVDRFGYSWLGWMYTKIDKVNQGNSLSSTTKVFSSSYSKNKGFSGNLPTFSETLFNSFKGSNSIKDITETAKFYYYGQDIVTKMIKLNKDGSYYTYDGNMNVDLTSENYSRQIQDITGTPYYIYYVSSDEKTLTISYSQFNISTTAGYVYFYEYNGTNCTKTSNYLPDNSYHSIPDYLNTFELNSGSNPTLSVYGNVVNENRVRGYFDTLYSSDAYKIKGIPGEGYQLEIDRSLSTMRYINLYAYWSANKYEIVFDEMDSNGTTLLNSTERGSSDSSGITLTGSNQYWFDDPSKSLASYLNGLYPRRVGYDFIGWTFNYIPSSSANLSSIAPGVNSPSSIIYLCEDMFAQYSGLSGYSDALESNVLMLNNGRISSYNSSHDASWILNAPTNSTTKNAERLGDGEGGDATRYIYLFALWKPQTFSINISLNIGKSELLNLYEKDSSFALALYNSDQSNFLGIDSRNYIFKSAADTTTNNGNNFSPYNSYYNDIVANVCFEIEFDQPFDTARCIIGGNTYYLKDLFATSAGYYFLGWMYQNTGNNYIVQNTLKSIFELNNGLVNTNTTGEVSTTGTFNYAFYTILQRSDFIKGNWSAKDNYECLAITNTTYVDGKGNINTNRRNENNISDSNGNNAGGYSTNFGYIRINNVNYFIMSEEVGGQYYLFIINNNVRYYVVFYEYITSGAGFIDNLTFDRTFLYYNIGANKYIIRFGTDGKAYYITNGFSGATEVSLRVAMYENRRNTLNKVISNGIENLVPSTSVGGNVFSSSYTLYTKTTRQFTLYAKWEVKTLTTSVNNGNNTTSGSDNSAHNPGLAGNYKIQYTNTSGSSATQVTTSQTEPGISADNVKFYSNLEYWFNTYYNGRYLSELDIEFDYLTENARNGYTSSYAMAHAKFVVYFTWVNADDAVDNRIVISGLYFNGDYINLTSALSTRKYTSSNTLYTTNENSDSFAYKLNQLLGIDLLSFIDQYNLGTTVNSSNTTTGFRIYNYNKDGNTSPSVLNNRTDICPITLKINQLMTNLTFTCKFSVQTYQVEIYTVVTDNNLSKEEVAGSELYRTDFINIAAMENSSNVIVGNRTLYGDPYISSVNFDSLSSSIYTISTNCAQLPTVTYNVPYGFYIVNSNITQLDTTANNGYDYIYENNYYQNGSGSANITQQKGGALSKYNGVIRNTQFTHLLWGVDPDDSAGYVRFKEHRDAQTEYIKNNKTIYGIYKSNVSATKVLFYYWDQSTGSYMQYANNEGLYTATEGSTGAQLKKSGNYYTVRNLPSPTVASWYSASGKQYQFVGYVYIDNEIAKGFALNGQYEASYNNLVYQYATTFTDLNYNLKSALKEKGLSDTEIANIMTDSFSSSFDATKLFKYRLTVYNNKYFVDEYDTTYFTGRFTTTSVLTGVGLKVPVDYNNDGTADVDVYKDFHILNSNLKILKGTTVYAIPIYEISELEFVGCNLSGGKLTITSNSNMIKSSVFDTTSNNTICYSPKDLTFIISNGSNVDLNGINNVIKSNSGIPDVAYTNSYIREINKLEKDHQTQIEVVSNNLGGNVGYLYAFYQKGTGNKQIAFKMTSVYLKLTVGLTSVSRMKAGQAYDVGEFSTNADVTISDYASENGDGGVYTPANIAFNRYSNWIDDTHNFQFNFTADDIYQSGDHYYVKTGSLIQKMLDKGLSKSIVSGIVANIYVECGFDFNDRTGEHYGLFQKTWSYDAPLWDFSMYDKDGNSRPYSTEQAVKDLNWQMTYAFYALSLKEELANLGRNAATGNYSGYGDIGGSDGGFSTNWWKTNIFQPAHDNKCLDGKGKAMQIGNLFSLNYEIPYNNPYMPMYRSDGSTRTDDAVINVQRAAISALIYKHFDDLLYNCCNFDIMEDEKDKIKRVSLYKSGNSFITDRDIVITNGSDYDNDISITIDKNTHLYRVNATGKYNDYVYENGDYKYDANGKKLMEEVSNTSRDVSRYGQICQVGDKYYYAYYGEMGGNDYRPSGWDQEIVYDAGPGTAPTGLVSPFDDLSNARLTGDWLQIYNNACSIIYDTSKNSSEINKYYIPRGNTNFPNGVTRANIRELVVKIALQLAMTNVVRYGYGSHYYAINYYNGYTEPSNLNPDRSGTYNHDLISAQNLLRKAIKNHIPPSNYVYNSSHQRYFLFTDCFGFLRLTYSLVAYQINPKDPHDVFGTFYAGYGNYQWNFGSSLNENPSVSGILPGDVLKNNGNSHVGMYLGVTPTGVVAPTTLDCTSVGNGNDHGKITYRRNNSWNSSNNGIKYDTTSYWVEFGGMFKFKS